MIGLSISASLIQLLIEGIPESFLFVLAVYIFTRIKLNVKKYLSLSLIFTFIIYLTRLLPINPGTHTLLSLLVLIIIFIITNKVDLQNIIKTITSAIIIAIIIAVSEELNILLFFAFLGQSKTDKLLSGSSIITTVCEIPSTIIFALIILISNLILIKIDKNKKAKSGKISEEISK